MSPRLFTPALTLALAAAATAAPRESVTYINVNSASSQVNAGAGPLNNTGANGVEVRNHSFTTAFSVQKIRVTAASLSRVDLDTFPSEARILMTPPIGTPFIVQPLDASNWPDPATITFDSYVLPLGTPLAAAGSWSFRFFESFQDGAASAANSIWDTLTIALDDGIAVAPPGTVDLGTLAPGSPANITNVPLAAGAVKWFKIILPAVPAPASNFVDIDTEGSLLAPNNATFLVLYNQAGDPVATDTDDGSGSLSQLSFGAGYRNAVGNGVRYDGRDGTLVGGLYYIAVSGTPAAAAGDLALDTFGTDTGTINLSLRSGAYTPAAFPSLPAPPAAGNAAEAEDNNSKAAANAARLAPGNTITGSTTGSSTVVTGLTSADYFLVYTDRQPGITRYRLVCTSPTVGHTVTLRGLSQTAPGPGPSAPVLGSDVQTQISLTTTTPPRYVQWYALGTTATPAVYARVTGAGATTQPYTLTLESLAVTPTAIAGGPLGTGDITITTVGTTGPVQTDTDLWLYDANFDPIALAGNDDNSVLSGGSGAGRGSRLVRSLVPGTYYLALTEVNLASNQVAAGDDRFKTGAILDFPGVVSTSSTSAAGLNVSFTIADSRGTPIRSVTASQNGPYDIRFFSFVVQNPAALRCNAADVAQLGGSPGPDGQNTADDIIVFLDAFFAGNAAIADIAILGGAPGSDGLLTADDIIFFLGQFFSPCTN